MVLKSVFLFFVLSAFCCYGQVNIIHIDRVDSAKTDSNEVEKSENYQTYLTEEITEPQFPGGKKALYDFLEQNVFVSAINDNTDNFFYSDECYSVIKFTVSKTGELLSLDIDESTNAGKAFKKAFLKMPNWKPATKNGEKTDAFVELPLRYNIRGNKIEFIRDENIITSVNTGRNGILKFILIAVAVIAVAVAIKY